MCSVVHWNIFVCVSEHLHRGYKLKSSTCVQLQGVWQPRGGIALPDIASQYAHYCAPVEVWKELCLTDRISHLPGKWKALCKIVKEHLGCDINGKKLGIRKHLLFPLLSFQRNTCDLFCLSWINYFQYF